MQNRGNEIPAERKASYYLGMALIAAGVMCFLGVPLYIIGNMPRVNPSIFVLAPIGMVILFVGRFLMSIGRSGLAGSGVILDPERAREDLKPWNQMKGQMIDDTVSQVDVVNRIADNLGGKPREVIKVRCPNCKALNDETDKFCGQCASKLA